MTDPTLRPRHWQEFEEATKAALPETLTFADVENLGLQNMKEAVVSIAEKARRQKDMEDRLRKLSNFMLCSTRFAAHSNLRPRSLLRKT